MVKKIFLNIDLCQEYQIIAISCHLKYYKLAYFVNSLLNFNFYKIPDLIFNNDANFNIFYFDDCENYSKFYLISNKSEKGFLFKKLKNIDYFFFINSQITKDEKKKLILKLKKIPGILTAFEINMNEIKGINDILIDIEDQIFTSIKN